VKDTLDKVRVLPSSDPAKYAALLKGLIIQGVSKLGETSVKVVCRREDLTIVQAAVEALNRDPHNHGVSISVHEQFLNAAW
jgi:vacuolar-type H+-ATPase subunit E/Vma4